MADIKYTSNDPKLGKSDEIDDYIDVLHTKYGFLQDLLLWWDEQPMTDYRERTIRSWFKMYQEQAEILKDFDPKKMNRGIQQGPMKGYYPKCLGSWKHVGFKSYDYYALYTLGSGSLLWQKTSSTNQWGPDLDGSVRRNLKVGPLDTFAGYKFHRLMKVSKP